MLLQLSGSYTTAVPFLAAVNGLCPTCEGIRKNSIERCFVPSECAKLQYVTQSVIDKFGIEEEFLVRVVKSPKEFSAIRLKESDLSTYLFACPLSLADLKKKGYRGALSYIQWGSSQETVARQKSRGGIPWSEAPSVRSRGQWYSIDPIPPADVICNRFFNERFFFGYAAFPVMEDQTFYGCTFNSRTKPLRMYQIGLLNSSLEFLFVELLGRVGLGQGVLQYATYEMSQLITLDAKQLSAGQRKDLLTAFENMENRKILPMEKELAMEDRHELDEVVFDVLGLTRGERAAVYAGVVELVWKRIEKAASA